MDQTTISDYFMPLARHVKLDNETGNNHVSRGYHAVESHRAQEQKGHVWKKDATLSNPSVFSDLCSHQYSKKRSQAS